MKKIVSILICVCIIGAGAYAVFNFTPERWSRDKEHRHLMIKDLEREYDIIGMTDEEIISLLGEPENTATLPTGTDAKCLSYYIASGYIDPVFYEIIFEDGVAVNTQKVEH